MARRRFGMRNLRHQGLLLACRLLPALRRWFFFVDGRISADDLAPGASIETHHAVQLNASQRTLLPYTINRIPEVIDFRATLYRFSNVTVLGCTGRLVDERRGALIRLPGDPTGPAYNDFRPGRQDLIVFDDGPALSLVHSHKGHAHLYHFLIERLPRLYYALERFGLKGQKLTILVNQDLAPFQRAAFDGVQKLYPQVRLCQVAANQRVQVAELWVVDLVMPVECPPGDPKALDFVRACLFTAYGLAPPEAGDRRYYISRGDARSRRILNESEVIQALQPYGFQAIEAGRLPFAEQVALFMRAEAIVAPHGAGLTHLLFAPPSAAVFELFSRDLVKEPFLFLATWRGQRHETWLAGDGEGRRGHWRIPVAPLRQKVERFLRREPLA